MSQKEESDQGLLCLLTKCKPMLAGSLLKYSCLGLKYEILSDLNDITIAYGGA